MSQVLQAIANSRYFQRFIIGVILFTGALVGMETYPAVVDRYGGALHLLDKGVLAIFVAEIAIKMGALGRKPWHFFRDPWNVFDFVVVAAAFLPFDAQYVTVLRLLRLLRVLRLVRALPELQVLVGALVKSLPSMAYVSLLLLLLFYVNGVAATFLFGANDPVHFGTLHISVLSLFRIVTLEGWTELLYIQMRGCADYGYDGMAALCTQSQAQPGLAVAFFVLFILLGTMIVLNLFIGVIMNGMAEAQKESDDARKMERSGEPDLGQELEDLERQLTDLGARVSQMKRQANRGRSAEASTPAISATGS